MPGKHITQQQVEIYMKSRQLGLNQVTAAAKAGFSEKTGRKLEKGHFKLKQQPREWRTRADPLSPMWEQVCEPLLQQTPQLTAITLLEHIQELAPDEYPDSMQRTLQRRVKQWKALHGEAREVIFRQEHSPGQQGLSDFTTLKRAQVTLVR